jgi:hypothetical protein
MRDPGAYEAEGRNDPLAPEQREEHPYDFVSLPGRPAIGQAVAHDRYLAERLTGALKLVYETEAPLHVGSGVFETAAECGLAGGTSPVRGIVRRLGSPVLPGSSWKGAVRARFEAITASRLGVRSRGGSVGIERLPAALTPPGARDRVEVRLPRLAEAGMVRGGQAGERGEQEVRRQLAALSPAEALFGAMGYRGRVHPGDGTIDGAAATEPLCVPPLESPALHRLAKPGAARVAGGRVEISQVEGRKFYYDGPVRHSRTLRAGEEDRPVYELIDYVPAGCTITLDLFVDSVAEAELGALLVSAGHGADGGVLRFGGYKPAGLGKVRLQRVGGQLRRGSGGARWRRAEGEALDAERIVAAARASGFIDAAALAELHEITTRLRP